MSGHEEIQLTLDLPIISYYEMSVKIKVGIIGIHWLYTSNSGHSMILFIQF